MDQEPVGCGMVVGESFVDTVIVGGGPVVSRREFLGSDEDFKRMDTNGDGLIDVQEADRADAELRKRARAKR